MKTISITTILLCTLITFTSAFVEKAESAQESSSQQKAVPQQNTPESSKDQKQEATTSSEKNLTFNSVRIYNGSKSVAIGKFASTVGAGGMLGESKPMKPTVDIIREISSGELEFAKKAGLKVGGAYIRNSQNDNEFEHIRDVDLALSDKELAKQFGVDQ